MSLAYLLIEYGILPCLLISSFISWYYNDFSYALCYIILFGILFYISRLFSSVSWVTQKQQQQIDTQYQNILHLTEKINQLTERLNETIKRMNDNTNYK